MIALLRSEIERDLSRRIVRVLVLLALVATALTAVLVFVNAKEGPARDAAPTDAGRGCRVEAGRLYDDLSRSGAAESLPPRGDFIRHQCQGLSVSTRGDTFSFRSLWDFNGPTGEAYLVPTTVFLAIGGLLAAASVVGAEWKAGTIGTLLTWEPRRVRVAIAKLAAAAMLAFLIAVALQVVFSAALWPTAALKGSTEGLDMEWWRGWAGAVLRSGALTAMAAVLGASVAFVGRSTSAALGFAVGYLVVFENVVRAWKPWLAPWLIGDSAGVFLSGERFELAEHTRDLPAAAATLVLYAFVAAVAAVVTFRARDVAAVG